MIKAKYCIIIIKVKFFLLLKVCFMLVACAERLSGKIKILFFFFHNTGNSVF